MIVEMIDDFFAEYPTAGSAKVDTGEADEVINAAQNSFSRSAPRQVDDFHAAPCAPRDVFRTRPRSYSRDNATCGRLAKRQCRCTSCLQARAAAQRTSSRMRRPR